MASFFYLAKLWRCHFKDISTHSSIHLFPFFFRKEESALKTKKKCTLWKVLIVPATDYFCVLRVYFAKPLNLVWLMKAPDTCQ